MNLKDTVRKIIKSWIRKAYWITPSGKIIDLKNINHSDFAKENVKGKEFQDIDYTDYDYEYMKLGAVRILNGSVAYYKNLDKMKIGLIKDIYIKEESFKNIIFEDRGTGKTASISREELLDLKNPGELRTSKTKDINKIIVYHAGKKDFDKFDLGQHISGFYPGIYAFKNKENTYKFGKILYTLEISGKFFNFDSHKQEEEMIEDTGRRGSGYVVVEKLKDSGYSGIIRGNDYEYIIFDPKDIKIIKKEPIKK